ncbi:MAG: hypothetical protein ACYTF7_07265 [Planctomycetota bacterium]|jgi:hypothetical protein
MTTEQRMHFPSRTTRTSLGAILALLVRMLVGCASSGNKLLPPRVLQTPYASVQGDVLWAVAPLKNESGVSVIDELALSDTLAAQIQQVRGISTIPVNRTLGVMQDLGIAQVGSPADARAIAKALGADAIVVGNITSWDPYDPPEFGLQLGLYVTNDPLSGQATNTSLDPRELQQATTDHGLPVVTSFNSPSSTAAEHMDASNHEIQQAVMTFAQGRHDPTQPLGWRRYIASMTLFTEFGCHRLTERLLDSERLRIARLRASAE